MELTWTRALNSPWAGYWRRPLQDRKPWGHPWRNSQKHRANGAEESGRFADLLNFFKIDKNSKRENWKVRWKSKNLLDQSRLTPIWLPMMVALSDSFPSVWRTTNSSVKFWGKCTTPQMSPLRVASMASSKVLKCTCGIRTQSISTLGFKL